MFFSTLIHTNPLLSQTFWYKYWSQTQLFLRSEFQKKKKKLRVLLACYNSKCEIKVSKLNRGGLWEWPLTVYTIDCGWSNEFDNRGAPEIGVNEYSVRWDGGRWLVYSCTVKIYQTMTTLKKNETTKMTKYDWLLCRFLRQVQSKCILTSFIPFPKCIENADWILEGKRGRYCDNFI